MSADVSPTGQGVDHRQVQRELGEMAVQLHEPTLLTASSIKISWNVSTCNTFEPLTIHPAADLISCLRLAISQVDRQSQYIQGYRLLYRPVGGSWSQQDVKAATERNAIITNLLKGTEYEIKIRPYFNEFQGMDSRPLTFHTPEEGEISAARSFDAVQFHFAVINWIGVHSARFNSILICRT